MSDRPLGVAKQISAGDSKVLGVWILENFILSCFIALFFPREKSLFLSKVCRRIGIGIGMELVFF